MPSEQFAFDVASLIQRFAIGTGSHRVGVDAVSISDFERQRAAIGGQHFIQTRFTPSEVAYAGDRVDRLAARWAAKEAVVKAIGTGFRGIRPGQIEIGRESTGRPLVRRATEEAWPFDAHLWVWEVSLCHEGDAALAVAMAVVPVEATQPDDVIR